MTRNGERKRNGYSGNTMKKSAIAILLEQMNQPKPQRELTQAEKRREQNRRYEAKHREKIREKHRAHYQRNREALLEKAKQRMRKLRA